MKPHKVVFIDEDLETLFNNLSDKDSIKKGLIKAIKDIKEDFGAGRLITNDTYKKKGIKNFLSKHGLDNLRIYNLPSAWRVLYSITKNQDLKIVAVLLDWMTHKDYEKLLR